MMSEKEQFDRLMHQMELLNKKSDILEQQNEKRDKKLDTILRGLYGDPENKTIGLIERQEQDEKNHIQIFEELKGVKRDVDKNTNFRKKVVNVTKVGGGVGGTSGAISFVAFFKEIKQFILQIFS